MAAERPCADYINVYIMSPTYWHWNIAVDLAKPAISMQSGQTNLSAFSSWSLIWWQILPGRQGHYPVDSSAAVEYRKLSINSCRNERQRHGPFSVTKQCLSQWENTLHMKHLTLVETLLNHRYEKAQITACFWMKLPVCHLSQTNLCKRPSSLNCMRSQVPVQKLTQYTTIISLSICLCKGILYRNSPKTLLRLQRNVSSVWRGVLL